VGGWAGASEFDFCPFLECGSALLCRFCFSCFASVFLWSAAVLCSAAFVSRVLPLFFTPQEKQKKQKRQSKALPHSTEKPSRQRQSLPHSKKGKKSN